MPYLLQRQLLGDGALLDQTSHWDISFNAGEPLPADLALPITFSIDTDSEGRVMPTLFAVPTLIARESFVELLRSVGVSNFDAYPARITNPESSELISDYRVVNILGLVAAANLARSESFELGPGLRVIDRIVLKGTRMPEQMFRLAEDPMQIIVSDRVAQAI